MFAIGAPPFKHVSKSNEKNCRNKKIAETKKPTIFLKNQL